ncbi:MAG: hypothetical protein ACXWN4_05760 [Candidatus Limnocylindrales bacterium]
MSGCRGFRFLAVVGLAAGVYGCVSPGASADISTSGIHQQAQDALARWSSALASSSGGPSFVLVSEKTLFVGNDWGPNIDGGNAKLAWYAGLFESDVDLPAESPSDAPILWSDGKTTSVPVISARQAFADMKAGPTQPCPDCTPLHVTGAKLTTARFDTSEGSAQAPAWEFSLKDTDVKLDQIAVAESFAPPAPPTPDSQNPPESAPWVGPAVQSATIDATGLVLTVTFVGAPDAGDKPCGADYTAEAVESDTGVVVVVFEHRNPLPVPCTAVGFERTAAVTLKRPLGNRTLIDLAAQPISVAAQH